MESLIRLKSINQKDQTEVRSGRYESLKLEKKVMLITLFCTFISKLLISSRRLKEELVYQPELQQSRKLP